MAQPLATLSVVAGELQSRCEGDASLQPLLRDLRLQLDNCQTTLGTLLSYGRQTLAGETRWGPLDELARDCVEAFRMRRPTVNVHLRIATGGPAPIVRQDQALVQGLLNLLGNAADVSEHWVELEVRWDAEEIVLSVLDRGPGIAPEAQRHIGRLFYTTKSNGAGNGLGLSLAHIAAERLGGWLHLTNSPGGGACAQVTLPMKTMAHDAARK
jgi:two-component system sensor histidine kinase RegB